MLGICIALATNIMLKTNWFGGSVPKINTNNDIHIIAEEISDYLADHPKAADSLEGVASWWLTRQRYERAEDIVQRALEQLVTQGVVKKVSHQGGKTVYSYAVENKKNETD